MDTAEPNDGCNDDAVTIDSPDTDASTEEAQRDKVSDKPAPTRPRLGFLTRGRPMTRALAAMMLMLLALGLLVGWLGWRAEQSHRATQQRALFLEVGRQGALNLTTINYTTADADIQRILDSATGTFYDDFRHRSQPFVDTVKQAQSKTEGTVVLGGLESFDDNHARVLVALTVKTTSAAAPEQQPRSWRMRIDVQKVGDSVKVSNVEFVT